MFGLRQGSGVVGRRTSSSFSTSVICGHIRSFHTSATRSSSSSSSNQEVKSAESFVFTAENFRRPQLPNDLNIIDVDVTPVESSATLEGYGYLVDDPEDHRAENKTFEICKWPVQGWRQLDPETGDEAGTTEGHFQVHWKGDFYFGKNLAINTRNNTYLDGLATRFPEQAVEEGEGIGVEEEGSGPNCLYLWMSDYHPDGGQLFFPAGEEEPCPFFVCLGKNTHGDDIKPENMCAFRIPAGKGVYIHPGTWHNGIYTNRKRGFRTFLTRQGRIHGRISCSWAQEFKTLLRLKLEE